MIGAYRIVSRAAWLVQDEDRRILQQGPGNDDPQPLPAVELDTAFSDECLQPLRHLPEKLGYVSRMGGSSDPCFRRMLRHAISNVGRDRIIEQHGLPGYQRDIGAQAGQPEVPEIVAIKQNPAGCRLDETRYHACENDRALRKTHQRRSFTRPYSKRYILQKRTMTGLRPRICPALSIRDILAILFMLLAVSYPLEPQLALCPMDFDRSDIPLGLPVQE